jgi:hypothetical protein
MWNPYCIDARQHIETERISGLVQCLLLLLLLLFVSDSVLGVNGNEMGIVECSNGAVSGADIRVGCGRPK